MTDGTQIAIVTVVAGAALVALVRPYLRRPSRRRALRPAGTARHPSAPTAPSGRPDTQLIRAAVSRLLYIDWLRGIAVLFMILWHSIDAWTVQTGRDTWAFTAHHLRGRLGRAAVSFSRGRVGLAGSGRASRAAG